MWKIKQKNIFNVKNGFSLLEVLVAMSILSVAMVGVLSLVIQNIQVQKVNKEFFMASMLAQEGLELVRNIRDYNWLHTDTNGTWTDIIGYINNNFIIDYDGELTVDVENIGDLSTITDDVACRLGLDANGMYNHSYVTPSIFYRIIEIDDSAPNNIEVSSRVEWVINGKVHNYIADTSLYDWR